MYQVNDIGAHWHAGGPLETLEGCGGCILRATMTDVFIAN